MKKWHIKITVTCMETNESIVFEYDANNKKADLQIWDVDLDNKSKLFQKAFIETLEMLWLTKKFISEIEKNEK